MPADPSSSATTEGFNPDDFAPLSRLEESNFWFRARNDLIVWLLRRYCPNLTSLLEIGCGTGYVLTGIAASFPQARLVGSEYFAEGLALAAGRCPSATFVQEDARSLEYNGTFDVVSAFDVIEHIDEDETVLANLCRSVRPGGTCLVSVPQHDWLWSHIDKIACHKRRYSKSELHNKMEAAGFEIVRSTSFTSLLLPFMLLSRKLPEGKDRQREFKLPALVNEVFYATLTLERAAISFGINFPIGGSRVVVARRPL